MSKGLGEYQRRILRILGYYPNEYFNRGGLARALGAIIYPELKEEDLKPKPSAKIENTFDLTREKLKEAIKKKDRPNKIINRILNSLKKKELIEIKKVGRNSTYVKISNKGLSVFKEYIKEKYKTWEGCLEDQKETQRLSNLPTLALNYKRKKRYDCKRKPIRLFSSTPLLAYLIRKMRS